MTLFSRVKDKLKKFLLPGFVVILFFAASFQLSCNGPGAPTPVFTPLSAFEGNTGRLVSMVAFSPNGQILAIAIEDGIIELWSPTTRELMRTLEADAGRVNAVAFSPDGEILASTSWPDEVTLWSPLTGNCC